MKNKKVFVFDFDGTLADSNELEKNTMVVTIECFSKTGFDQENIYQYYGPSEKGIIRKLVPEERFDEAWAFYLNYYDKLQKENFALFDGMIDLLDEIREKGGRVFLLTGRSSETLALSLEYLNLENKFEKCYSGSEEGVVKGSNMDKLIEEFDLDRDEVLYIGDSRADVRSMREVNVDILTAGYSHDESYQKKLEDCNPGNVAYSVSELKERILSLIL